MVKKGPVQELFNGVNTLEISYGTRAIAGVKLSRISNLIGSSVEHAALELIWYIVTVIFLLFSQPREVFAGWSSCLARVACPHGRRYSRRLREIVINRPIDKSVDGKRALSTSSLMT